MIEIKDVDDLRAALASSLSREDRRHVVKEARRLGRCDLLPRWHQGIRPSEREDPVGIEETLASKAASSGIALAKLRCVYMRGVTEYESLTASALSRDDWAQARVNTFIRLAAGSKLVRRDDADLLAH